MTVSHEMKISCPHVLLDDLVEGEMVTEEFVNL